MRKVTPEKKVNPGLARHTLGAGHWKGNGGEALHRWRGTKIIRAKGKKKHKQTAEKEKKIPAQADGRKNIVQAENSNLLPPPPIAFLMSVTLYDASHETFLFISTSM